jgi:transcriptional regulator of acetoin/glycerol metabolism
VNPTDSLVDAGPLRYVSRLLVEKMLASCDGNVSLAAKRLGISRSTLYRYLKEAH